VQRALRLIEAVSDHNGHATAKQLARSTDIALPTVYHLLRTQLATLYGKRVALCPRTSRSSLSALTG
jgi:hypothetical protein